jgi:hypothetical protein
VSMNQMLICQPPFDSALVRVVADLLRPDAIVPPDPVQGFDPESFEYLARYWHVAPSLWLRLRDCSGVPAIVRNRLRAEYWRNTKANTELRTAANELVATLNAQGVVPMLLKGGCQLFDPPAGHAGTRFMVDIDLLAPLGQDRISFDTLCARGFVPTEGWDTDALHHWPKLTRPSDSLAVEIHKTPWLGGGTGETEAFFASSIPLVNITGNARLPCASHRLLHNAIHAFDGLFRYVALWADYDLDKMIGCVNLRQLLDFVELCSFRGDELDWGTILADADRFGHTSDLRQWGAMARELCALPLSDDVATWKVNRPELRTIRARCRYIARATLHKTKLVGPVRRWKSRLLS